MGEKIITLSALCMLTLSACATNQPSFNRSSYLCAGFNPIYVSEDFLKSDFYEEKKAILKHNNTGQKICGWK